MVLNASQCSCVTEEEECHLCCQLEDQECMSTIALAEMDSSLLPGGTGLQLPVGAPCNNFRGYCDFLNNCFQVDSEGMLDRRGREGGRDTAKVLNLRRSDYWVQDFQQAHRTKDDIFLCVYKYRIFSPQNLNFSFRYSVSSVLLSHLQEHWTD